MSDTSDEVDRLEEPVKISEVKQKRQLSQKQLDNLSKAREKAREDKVAAEMRVLQSEQEPKPKTPKPIMKKPTLKRTKKPKVVYYSSSSSDDSSSDDSSSSEEEVQYRRRPTKQKRERHTSEHKPPRISIPPSAQSENEDAMVEQQYQQNMRKMKRDMLMQSVFPSG